ncbi:ExbD/TolR family protein [Phycisphaera mikurensis]|uniref:ExbD/TolR family protein n=1 Tax=Phycisphaera mikurensis (strain NBRC 102666 / KCTC 22515 / FYK2301M01) TaxID=1142394 RepID=I0IAA4_PHYMF|nr:biopolymer transporter ExbD [Phycisphaera mikurensis]MBB6441808.1 biopolymer transport protein ExbD [Phycisphaera mikurensis]BAM02192.1 ExbD/TolR family protein [Phycisphaera mikurensis NBRC 102666]
MDARRSAKRRGVTPTMNLTPLIDVTFLLIVFFMLVNNIVASELVPLLPPTPSDPQTSETPEADTLIVSIAPQPFGDGRAQQPLNHDGRASFVQVGALGRFEPGDAAGITAAVREAVARRPGVRVLLRADAALFQDQVRPVMAAVTAAGVAKIDVVAGTDR